MRQRHCWTTCVALCVVASGCSQGESPSRSSPRGRADQPPRIEKLESVRLSNVYRIHEKVISGGMPEGDAAFRELQQLGIKTVISVDGAKPDVATARKFGLRYVHLPHGYDGISKERGIELAKAVRDLDGPIYIHCHHGKHRSPAAATVACIGAGFLAPELALSVLRTAGTSDHYRGLYDSAEQASRIDDQLLDALDVEFQEVAPLPPLAENMVEMERAFDRIRLAEKAGWRSPADHPDVDPPHEALMLREHFAELQRTADVRQRPNRFREFLNDSLSAAEELEAALRRHDTEDNGSRARTTAGLALDRVSKNCTACHQQFRDMPRANPRESR